MKKIYALYGALLLILPLTSSAENLTVQVKKAQLRENPGFLSKILTDVPYQSSVEVVDKRGAWRLVKFKNQQGWLHLSASVQPKPLKLLSFAGKGFTSSVSSKETSLAGKGFKLEEEFKKTHGDADFKTVDQMEQIAVSASELEKFSAEGEFAILNR